MGLVGTLLTGAILSLTHRVERNEERFSVLQNRVATIEGQLAAGRSIRLLENGP